MVDELTFVCDNMVIRLGRWLRLLGYNTIFGDNLTDEELLKIINEKNSKRILLTRDLELYKQAIKRGLDAFILTDTNYLTQLFTVIKKYNLRRKIEPINSRCSKCGAPLAKVADKNEIKNKVPPKVLARNHEFWRCVNCGKIYWKGKMWDNIIKVIEKLNSM
ncbi:MAG: Mut7-C RNAse domain-containing protein [Candidatus Odinarchaeia archaeon]